MPGDSNAPSWRMAISAHPLEALAIGQQYVDGEISVDKMTAAIVALSTDRSRRP
jgi:hypothetical protein